MARKVSIPLGAWPLEMPAEMAAGYTGEPSVKSFRDKVKRGVYSPPAKRPGMQDKWHRQKLDQDINCAHGLRVECPFVEDATELI